jgi:hypothetical protein
MIKKTTLTVLPFLAVVLLNGCAGYDRVLFATKTNIGIDVDSTPPTAEASIARQEIAIQPTYGDSDNKVNESNKNDQNTNLITAGTNNLEHHEISLPLLGAFGTHGNLISPRFTGYFAGGEAAVNLASENLPKEDPDKPIESSVCFKNEPKDLRGPLRKLIDFFKFWTNEEIDQAKFNETQRPFYFATDTLLGMKASWAGTSPIAPDGLKIGYNRKEYASAPIYKYDGCDNISDKNNKSDKLHQIKLPSFLASIDNASYWEAFSNSGLNHTQFFATGRAATEFSKRESVRQIAFRDMAPDASKIDEFRFVQTLKEHIKNTFQKLPATKKQEIMQEAIKNNIVPKSTDSIHFIDELDKYSGNFESYLPLIKISGY